HIFGGRHAQENAILLLFGPELKERRRQQKDAVLRDPLRRARAPIFLFEDQPLRERRFAPAVFLRPRHRGPSRFEEPLLPFAMKREPCGRIARRPRFARRVRAQPRAHLTAERFVFLRVLELHHFFSSLARSLSAIVFASSPAR